MKLSKEEEQIILRLREENKMPVAIKQGVLKHDLYVCKDSCYFPDTEYKIKKTQLFSIEELKNLVLEFRNNFEIFLKPGDIFECFIKNEKELWIEKKSAYIDYGNFFGFVKDEEWAKLNLEDIKNI